MFHFTFPQSLSLFRVLIAALALFLLSAFSISQPEVKADSPTYEQPFPSFGWVFVSWDDDLLTLTLSNIEPGSFQIFELDNPPRIVFDLPDRKCPENESVYETMDFNGIPLLVQLRASCTEDGVVVVLESRYPLFWQLTSNEDDRFVQIQCLLRFRQAVEQVALDEGTIYIAKRYVTTSGQRFVHAVISDPAQSRLRPRIILAGEVSTRNLTSLQNIVTGSRAAVGINGGYFSWPGVSLSLVVRYGDIHAPPQLHRPAFMVLDDGRYIMDYPPIQGVVTSASGLRWEVDLINQIPGYGQVALLTPGHPSRLREDLTTNFAVLFNGVVEHVNPGELDDLSGRYILWSRRNSPSLYFLGFGEAVDIEIFINDGRNSIRHALQGGPFLVRNGVVNVTTEQDDIGDDIANGRSARTAVGIDDNNRIYLVTVEGTAGGRSIGSTLEELAWTLLDLGCTWAINLDGGSSTGMAMSFNSPESGLPSGSRQISTALVLIDESGSMQGDRFYF